MGMVEIKINKCLTCYIDETLTYPKIYISNGITDPSFTRIVFSDYNRQDKRAMLRISKQVKSGKVKNLADLFDLMSGKMILRKAYKDDILKMQVDTFEIPHSLEL